MEETRGGLTFLDDFVGGIESYASTTQSPLSRVPVQGYLSSEPINVYSEAGANPYGRSDLMAEATPSAATEFGCSAPGGSVPFRHTFRSDKDLPGACLDQEGLRATALQSVESSLSNFEYPNTPSKMFTEPARLDEASPFSLTSLDFLDDQETGMSNMTRSIQLKVATAPADLMFTPNSDFSTRASFNESCTSAMARSSRSRGLLPGDRGSASGTPSASRSKEAPDKSETDAPLGLHEIRGASMPIAQGVGFREIVNGQSHSVQTGQSGSQCPAEDWNGSDAVRGGEKSGVNPRKTEQNRRAQARFRQRKKDMFFDQKRQIQNLAARLEAAMKERKSYEEKTSQLQQLVDAKEKKIENLELCNKDSQSVEEMSTACWDFVVELRKGRRSLGHTRETVSEMVNAMILWGSPAIGFIRKELVEQLSELLKQDGRHSHVPSRLWMNDLIHAYERMIQRCGECHPQALRMFLGIQLQPTAQHPDGPFWRRVLEAGGLGSDQMAQLASARHTLVSKMQQHVARRAEIARLVQTGGPATAETQQPLLGNMAQSQLVLDLHMQTLKEEKTAVFNFLSIVRLVLEPMQQAKLMVAAYPFALDLLAISSAITECSSNFNALSSSLTLLSQLPQDSPFQSLTPNAK